MTTKIAHAEEIDDICRRYGHNPENVRHITLTPNTIEITEFVLDAQGHKHITGPDGQAATKTHTYTLETA